MTEHQRVPISGTISCLVCLAGSVGYAWLLRPRLGLTPAIIIGLFGSAFLTAGVAGVVAVARGRSRDGKAGIVISVLFHVFLALIWFLSGLPGAKRGIDFQGRSIQSLVQDGDRDAVESFVRDGGNVNDGEAGGSNALFYAQDTEMKALLIDLGANPNARDHEGDTILQEAARANEVEVLQRLITAGADLEARSTAYGTTALEDALDQERTEAIAILRAAGAIDPSVTAATGRPLPPDGGPPFAAVRTWIAAIHARDRATMDRVYVGLVPKKTGDEAKAEEPTDENWDNWQSVQPLDPIFVGGFWNDNAATLTVRGVTPHSFDAVWVHRLVRFDAEAVAEATGSGGGTWLIRDSAWRTSGEVPPEHLAAGSLPAEAPPP